MKLDTYFTPAQLRTAEVEAVVVIDVLRATSTIVEALHNGARGIFPVESAEDAAALAQNVGRDSMLLCGERNGLAIEGFDLGNSPAEFTAERVEDQVLAMTTTNGTRALVMATERAGGEPRVLVGSFLNLGAVVEHLRDLAPSAAALVCSGREGRFALEDALCAGALIAELEAGTTLELNDAAAAARRLAEATTDLEAALADTAAGRGLRDIGFEADIAFCAQRDRSRTVPELRERKITAV